MFVLDAFMFSLVLLATQFSGCVHICFFQFIPCFLDAFVISCVLLAPLFSECVSACCSNSSCVFVHAFVFCIISLAMFSFWMCLHHFFKLSLYFY